MRLFSKTNLVFAVIFIGVVFLLIAPLPAQAGMVQDAVGEVIDILGYALNSIFGLVLIFAGWAVDIMLQLNFDILNTSNQIVLIGWTIVRDLTNLGFVLLAIIIAIATIIRYQDYAAKTLLLKLIAVAILVNFSLVIAGTAIQFSNVLTNFFISQVAPQGTTLSESLGGVLNPQKIFSPDPDPKPPDPQTIGSGFASLVTRVATVVFNVAFTAIAAITMLAFAFMLLLRYIYLSFLLIFVPFICLAYVFPALKEYWGKWMTNFTKWLLFAPALSFFIYIAFVAARQFGDNKTIQTAAMLGDWGDLFNTGIQMVILCGILLGGLITAESMGITGATAALGAARGLGNGAKQWAGNKAKRGAMATGQAMARSVPGKFISEKLVRAGEELKSASKKEETKSLWTGAGWRGGNLLKILGNTLTAPVRKPLGGLGKMASGTGKDIQKTASSKLPESVSLMGSMLRGVGLLKKSEKKEEEKSYAELAGDLEKLLQRKKELGEGANTKIIDNEISVLISKIRKAEKQPDSIRGWEEGLVTLQEKRDKLLEKRLETKFYDDQIAHANQEIQKLGEIESKKSEPRKEWEKKIKEAYDARDKAVVNKKPDEVADYDAQIKDATTAAKMWQELDNNKPQNPAQWEERLGKLQSAKSGAIGKLDKLIVDKIDKEIEYAEKQATNTP